MLCEECGVNEASVHIQAIGPDGTSTGRAVCEECFNKIRSKMGGSGVLDLGSLFGALMQKFQQKQEKEQDRFEGSCPNCGMTWSKVRSSGVVGCSGCYKAFHEPIEELLVKNNGSALYVAAMPDDTVNNREKVFRLRSLRAKMAEAIEKEDFEQAARIRDEIRGLEDKGESYAG